MTLRLCSCGLAMYAVEAPDGGWVYVCEDCDPNLGQPIAEGSA